MAKEYIEREAAIEETRKPRLTDAELRRRLSLIPAADVVEVVRCKDCKYGNPCKSASGVEMIDCWNIGTPCGEYDFLLPQDWFCADGERREVQDG